MGKPLGAKDVCWSDEMRRDFLDHLASTGNISASARVIGVGLGSVYNLRRRDPGFAAEWGEALKLGYQMLETRLMGHVLAGKNRVDPVNPEEDISIDASTALSMLAAHRASLAGITRQSSYPLKRASEEETNAALMQKLDAVEKRLREKGA
jgi:hypothetical protein